MGGFCFFRYTSKQGKPIMNPETYKQELAGLQEKLQDPDVYGRKDYPQIAKRASELTDIVALFDRKTQLQEAYRQASELVNGDDDLAILAQEELRETETALTIIETRLIDAKRPQRCKKLYHRNPGRRWRR